MSSINGENQANRAKQMVMAREFYLRQREQRKFLCMCAGFYVEPITPLVTHPRLPRYHWRHSEHINTDTWGHDTPEGAWSMAWAYMLETSIAAERAGEASLPDAASVLPPR